MHEYAWESSVQCKPMALNSQRSGCPLHTRQSSPRAKTPSGFNTEGCRGGVALVRAPPPAPVRLDQFGNRARTGGQDEWRVPFVQYPIYDRSCHTSQSAHCNLCGNDQTSTHAVLKWSGVAAALVNPLYLDISRTTMPYRLQVAYLDLLWVGAFGLRFTPGEWRP